MDPARCCSAAPAPASRIPDGAWVVEHFSSPTIDLLLTRLMAHKDKILQDFFDVFFGSRLTKDPNDECWLKVRTPTADQQPGCSLSFKRSKRPTLETSVPFTLLTDPKEVKNTVAAKLELAHEDVFEQLKPFLALYVHRVSVKSFSGDVELWVDSACRTTFRKKTTLARALQDPSLLGAAMPLGKHEWFVSCGCRFRPGTLSSTPSCNTLSFAFAALAMFGLECEVQSLVWVPSKAYHFRGLARDQALQLKESDPNMLFTYHEFAHVRHLDPLNNSGLILSQSAPDRATWLKAWSAALFDEDVEEMRTSLLEKGLEAVDALLPAGSPSDGPAWAEALYSMPARAFVEIRVGKHMVGAVLYQMLHLWEAQFPLTHEQLQDILSHDPTNSVAIAILSRLNRLQLLQLLSAKDFSCRPLKARQSCIDELYIYDTIVCGFNNFQMDFKCPPVYYCHSLCWG